MSRDWRWSNCRDESSIAFTCGFCGREVAESWGYSSRNEISPVFERNVRICHHCEHATYFDDDGNQFPAPAFGAVIPNLEGVDVGRLYDEARSAFSVNSYTAAVLCCRILLMHVAVDHGAPQNQSFVTYIDYLCDENIVPKKARDWVDVIRKVGNNANHEIRLIDRELAESVLRFTEMLLKITYDYPAVATQLAKQTK